MACRWQGSKPNKMKANIFPVSVAIVLLCAGLCSCQAIGDIFKAGVWTGVLLVVGIVALIIFIISKVAGKK